MIVASLIYYALYYALKVLFISIKSIEMHPPELQQNPRKQIPYPAPTIMPNSSIRSDSYSQSFID
jgi:hypothetical protein